MSATGRALRVLGEAVLTLLSILGALCIVLVAAAFLFNITLMMFKTGSMSPTIPAGAVAVVREIPASEVEVGDVVTIDRAGQLPVTHRVTSVQRAQDPDERVITMKGDANQQDDPQPYTVAKVRIVMFSVPGVARVIAAMSNPYVLGGITIGATLLVTCAFWPRSTNQPRRAKPGAMVVIVLLVGSGWAAAMPEIAVADEIEMVRGEHLTLTSIVDPGMRNMRPGATVHWQVGVSADVDEPGSVTVSLSGAGDPSLELGAEVMVCSQRWVGATCPGTSWRLTSFDPLPLDGVRSDLLSWPSDEERWFLFTVSMPDSAEPTPGGVVTQVVHADGQGESVSVGDHSIADTGAPDLRWPLALATFAIIGGFLLSRLGRLRGVRAGDSDGGGQP